MLKKFRMKAWVKPIYGEDSTRKYMTLRSTLRVIKCYRCGFGGGTLTKHSIGYVHQDPNRCTQNIKGRNFQKTALRILRERIRKYKRIDYKIWMWLRRKWLMVWKFFKRFAK